MRIKLASVALGLALATSVGLPRRAGADFLETFDSGSGNVHRQ